jgi:coenzyme F420-reducing hydrogenase alpha subunit
MTKVNLDINIHYLTRVEGHGNIVVSIKKGKPEQIEWQIPEAPRFFEAMVIGQKWDVIHHIVSRICGICAIGHTLASLKATEAAMGIKLSKQTQKLRRLAIHGENLQSHILHIGYLVLPDLMSVGSIIPLASSNSEELKTVIRIHRLANEMSDLICGRTTHPQRLIPGGFTKFPTEDQLKSMKQRILDSENDVKVITDLLKALAPKIPNFTRETEYVGLTCDDGYALYDGDLASTDGGRDSVNEYLSWTNEYIVPQSTAKYTKRKRDSLMVGALARFNINHKQLKTKAKATAKELGLKAPCYNPYMNTVAQYVECIHTLEDSVDIIDDLLKTGINHDETYPKITPKAGHGVGLVEVPRGILIHDYTYDGNGVCTAANCIIPTNQNHANIQLDMEKLVPEIMDKPKDEVELTLEMLVRAYDPCISCSTHYLKVEFKDE